jgi:hypothetical protein
LVLLAALLLNNRKTNLVSENASPEGVKAEVPDRHHGGVLENVCPVQEQEDAPVKITGISLLHLIFGISSSLVSETIFC